MSYFIVKDSTARMPLSCWGKYRRVAVLEVEDYVRSVSMISERAIGVIRIVATWENLNVGVTERSAYHKARVAADKMALELNSPLYLLVRAVKQEEEGETR